MESEDNENDSILLPHHEQQELCTTRLPYRQGRKLTAVKVYTVNDESRHLLIFGVPSLNLRQETKSLFMRFGRLLQFTISKEHACEQFTETYHAVYERIQSARYSKKMLDTKNFYGGTLHICYAPEYETLNETRDKLNQRRKDVAYRLKLLAQESTNSKIFKEHVNILDETVRIQPQDLNNTSQSSKSTSNICDNASYTNHPSFSSNCIGPQLSTTTKKLNMGEVNVIGVGKQIRDVVKKNLKRKIKENSVVLVEKQFKASISGVNERIDVVDLTSVEKEVVTNINESLNCVVDRNNVVIKKVNVKPMNVIKFNLSNKKS